MNNLLKKSALALAIWAGFLFSPSISAAGIFGPSNFDECILESMKGVTSDFAARAIYKSCREKFPAKSSKPKSAKLPQSALKALTGRASVTTGETYGNIYNGNKEWIVTSIIISLRDNDDPYLSEKKYKVRVAIPPYSTDKFSVSTDWVKGDNDSWQINEAYGYRNN